MTPGIIGTCADIQCGIGTCVENEGRVHCLCPAGYGGDSCDIGKLYTFIISRTEVQFSLLIP